jgi:hypothetical protein
MIRLIFPTFQVRAVCRAHFLQSFTDKIRPDDGLAGKLSLKPELQIGHNFVTLW